MINFITSHMALIWGILFALSEALGFSSKGGILSAIADFLKAKAQPPSGS